MLIQSITLFPEMFDSITEYGVTGRARKQNLWQFKAINPRQFSDNKLGYIDDRPFGGGPGMIMQAPPLQAAIDEAKKKKTPLITAKSFTLVRRAHCSTIKNQLN